jgi:hypothetical protein
MLKEAIEILSSLFNANRKTTLYNYYVYELECHTRSQNFV